MEENGHGWEMEAELENKMSHLSEWLDVEAWLKYVSMDLLVEDQAAFGERGPWLMQTLELVFPLASIGVWEAKTKRDMRVASFLFPMTDFYGVKGIVNAIDDFGSKGIPSRVVA
eukprot:15357799-Ditylum_brightwellii.AAC.2